MLLRKFARLSLLSVFVFGVSAGAVSLTGCDVDVNDPNPVEDVADDDNLEVEVD